MHKGKSDKDVETAYLCRAFCLTVEKNSELPLGHILRKYKGRVVFQGNNVWDTNYDYAIFQDLSSNPATMEAAKAADLVALLPGNIGQQADAEQAYVQAELHGPETWVYIPPEGRPPR